MSGKSMGERLLEQMRKESGWHKSRSDSNDHLSIKNSGSEVIGHMYKDGGIKGTNRGGSGALSWLIKK